MTEWLDIVDEHDNVVGRDTRANIHAAGQLHRSSHVLLFNTGGLVFVQRRSLHKDTNPGLWDTSAAGHVDSGESYVQCAVREVQEELGVSVQALTPIGTLEPRLCNGFEFTHIFTGCSDEPLVLQQDEVADGRWLLPADLSSWIALDSEQFTDVFRIIWTLYVNQTAV